MNSNKIKLENAIVQLKKKSFSEKKNGCSQLKLLLEDESIVTFLNEDPKNNLWLSIFDAIYNCITKEYAKTSDEANKSSMKNDKFILVLTIIISKAMKGGPKLNSSTVVSQLLGILNYNIDSPNIREICIECINSSILIYRKCCIDLSSKYYLELLNFALDNLKKKNSLELNYELLRLLDLILSNANEHSQIMDILISKFQILDDFFCQEAYKNDILQRALVPLTLTFTKKILNESNKILLKFGEEHLFDIFKIYLRLNRTIKNDEIKNEIFQIMLIQLQLHHPIEITDEYDEYLDYFSINISAWHKSIDFIHQLVNTELEIYNPTESIPPYLTSLAIETYRQLFLKTDLKTDDEISHSKRRKYMDPFESFLTKFEDVKTIGKQWFFLNIFEMLICQYPTILNNKVKNIVNLLNLLENALNETLDDAFLSEIIFKLLSTILSITKSMEFDNNNSSELKKIWNCIKNICIQNLSMIDKPNIHILIQELIKNNYIDDLENILKLFYNKSIKLTKFSMITLDIVMHFGKWQNVIIKTHDKILLLEWLFSTQEINSQENHILCKMIGLIAIKLCSKNSYEASESCLYSESSCDIPKPTIYPEIFSYSNYKYKYFKNKNFFKNIPLNLEILEILFEHINKFNNSLNKDFHHQNNVIKILEFCLIVSYIIIFLDLDKDNTKKNILLKKIKEWKNILDNIYETIIIPYINNIQTQDSMTNNILEESYDALKLFNHLIEVDFVCFGLLYHQINNELIKILMMTCRIKPKIGFYISEASETLKFHEDPEILLRNNLLDKTEQTKILITEIICKHSFLTKDSKTYEREKYLKSSEISNKMIKHILSSIINQDIIIDNIYEFQMVYTYLKNIIKCGDFLHERNIQKLIMVYMILFKKFYQDQAAIYVILKLIQDSLFYFKDNKNFQNFAHKYLENFREKLKSFTFGLTIKLKYIECSGLSIRNPFHSQFYLEEIINFLKDDNLQIRTAAVRFLPEILNILNEKKTDIRNNIENILKFKSSYQTYTHLHTLAILIMNLPQYLIFGLYHLAKLFFKGSFSIVDYKIIFNCVIKYLKIKDTETLFKNKFERIIYLWINNKNDLKDFPYQLLGFKYYEQFQENFKFLTFPILFAKEQKNYKDLFIKNKCLIEKCPVNLLGILLLEVICHDNKLCYQKINFLVEELGEVTIKQLINKVQPKLIAYLINNSLCLEKLQTILKQKNIPKFFDELWPLEYPHKYIFNLNNSHPLFENFSGDNTIWKLHLELKLNIYNRIYKFDKIKALCDYGIFIDFIIDNKNIEKDISEDIILSLVHLLKIDDEQITIVVSHLINFCFNKFLNYNALLIGMNLNKIIYLLMIYATKDNPLGEIILKLIENLLKSSQLQIYLQHLNPFPQEERFLSINKIASSVKNENISLISKIQLFNQDKNVNISSEQKLQKIYDLLSLNETEIKRNYKILNHENCKNSESYCYLHELFNNLFQHLWSSDLKIRIISGKCLGKLGVIDFEIYGDLSKPDITFENINNPLKTFIFNLCPILLEAIHDDNPEIILSASEIYYYIIFDSSNINRYFIEDINIAFLSNIQKIWNPDNSIIYVEWVKNLTRSLLKNCFKDSLLINHLVSICSFREMFATQFLPHLTLFLSSISQTFYKSTGNSMELFLRKHLKNITDKDDKNIYIKSQALKLIIKIIEYCRMFNYYKSNFIKMRNPFGIKQIYIAQAALTCKLYFTSLYYIEIWQKDNKDNDSLTNQAENILRCCYNNLGNFEQISGFGDNYFTNIDNRIMHYSNIGKYHNALEISELKLRTTNNKIQDNLGMLRSLKRVGYFENMYCYLLGLKSQGLYVESMEKYEYECCWRLSQWDTKPLMFDSKQEDYLNISKNSFEMYHFHTLKALIEKENNFYSKFIYCAREQIIDALVNESLESPLELFQAISKFQCLEELEDFQKAILNSSLDRLITIWRHPSDISESKFSYIEPIICQRSVLLKNHFKDINLGEHMIPSYIHFADMAFKASDYLTANTFVQSIKSLEPANFEIIFKEALICWKQKDIVVAKALLNQVIQELQFITNLTNSQKIICANSLKLFGDILVKTKSENSQIVIKNYYKKSIEILKSVGNQEVTKELNYSYNALASFANEQYQNIKNYLQMMEKMKKDVIEKSKVEATQLEKEIISNSFNSRKKDNIQKCNYLKKQIKVDEAQIDRHYQEKENYLEMSIKYCLYSLANFSSNNHNVFRLISNWIENKTLESIKVHLERFLPSIPSYVFLTLIPQLSPHLGVNESKEFRETLHNLLKRCAIEHPHHTLTILIAQAEPFKDEEFISSGTTRDKTPQSKGSEILLHDLIKNNSKIQSILSEYRQLFSASIQFAYADKSESRDLQIFKLKPLSKIFIPTYEVPIDLTLRYDNVIGIRKFDKNFIEMSGINKPKKITCLLLDGSSTTLLIKGQDDLRQDAIMQQIFNIMNLLMNEENNELENRLIMRTYKVVAMSQRSGMIQWCNNTITLASYLFGTPLKKGAHQRYFPEDWDFLKCRTKIKDAFQTNDQNRLNVFYDIYKHFHPVLSTFFKENYVNTKNWYNKRNAFIKSVAVSSMVGYIMGIGDRHCSNILIDLKTAEVIHIDFGFIFELSKFLNVPETVPFRLTQNIVDALGVTGVEGNFIKICEKSLQALKNHQDVISTIIEVLLYDPLYSWNIKPEILSKMKDTSSVNTSAERVLIRFKEKLQGMEDGQFLTTTGQVRFLIQQANDPSLLCRLFHGWCAFA